MLKVVSLCVVVGWFLVGAHAAHAQVGIPYKIYDWEHWPESYTKRTLTLPEGQAEVGGDVDLFLTGRTVDLGAGNSFTQSNIIVVSPHVQYGINSLVTLGFAQATTFAIVPDNSDPTIIGAEKLDYHPGGFLLEGIFKFVGAYDVAAHVQLPIHYFGGQDATPMESGVPSATFIDMRVAIEGRVAFADRMGNLRFRAGFVAQDINHSAKGAPDLQIDLLYQTTKQFMIGLELGITAPPWMIGDSNDTIAPLEVVALYNIIPELDLTLHAGILQDLSHDVPPNPLPLVSIGVLYRP